MYKKTIKYTDYNDVEREEDFFFNLSEVELTEMEASVPGGLIAKMEKAVKDKDGAALMGIIKTFILNSYGVKSDDGRRFIKDPKLTEEFMQTPAYGAFYMDLATNENAASSFITGILPPKLRAQAEKASKAKVENLTDNKPSST